jgi:hypothetical protein
MCGKVAAMKKRYNVTLDQEKVEELQAWLEKKHLSLSGYLNAILCEQTAVVKMLGVPVDVASMPLGEFAGLFSRIVKGLTAKP